MIWPILSYCVALFYAFQFVSCASVTVQSNTVLDSKGIYFVSYDGLVNVNSFEISGIITYNGYQYATWYTSTRYAMIGRRQLGSSTWSVVQLQRQLSTNDSHNVVVLGVSPQDGRIHIALDCHSTTMYYIVSVANLATNPGSMTWSSSQFGSPQTTLNGVNLGSQITYPQFVLAANGRLQLSYRTGVSGNGQASIAEYNGSSWSILGAWSSATGTYKSTNSATSTARNLYIHGYTYRGSRLHSSGTWRETNSAVLCNSGGLTNHDTVYVYSDDSGRTWKNSGGSTVATTGSSTLVSVSSSNIIVDSLDPNHGLMNQESQDVDSAGLPHIMISYVPGRFTQCVTSYQSDRTSYGRAFHVWKNSTSLWTKYEVPFALNAVGRSQLVMDSKDNAWAVLPYVRVAVATKAGGWKDWTLVYDGQSNGLGAFGEVIVDRTRLQSGQDVLSVMYQKSSSGTNPSEVHVIDFTLNP